MADLVGVLPVHAAERQAGEPLGGGRVDLGPGEEGREEGRASIPDCNPAVEWTASATLSPPPRAPGRGPDPRPAPSSRPSWAAPRPGTRRRGTWPTACRARSSSDGGRARPGRGGASRMNRLAVVKATWGLGSTSFMRRHAARPRRAGPGRPLTAAIEPRFAEDGRPCSTASASPCASSRPVPTPLIAFAALLGAAAAHGHRQPQPAALQRLQGLLANGAQIVPPVTQGSRPPSRRRAPAPSRRQAPAEAAAHGLRPSSTPRRPRSRRPTSAASRGALHEAGRAAAHRLHGDARRGQPARGAGARRGRLHGVAAEPAAGRSRRRLPHGLLPQPGGAGGDGPRPRAGDGDRRRARPGERSRRRPPGRAVPDPSGRG